VLSELSHTDELIQHLKISHVSNKLVPKIKRGKAELMPHKVKIQLMPIKFQITKCFEISGALNLTVKNQKDEKENYLQLC